MYSVLLFFSFSFFKLGKCYGGHYLWTPHCANDEGDRVLTVPNQLAMAITHTKEFIILLLTGFISWFLVRMGPVF